MTTSTGPFRYFRILLVAALLGLTLKLFVLDAVVVPGRSMSETILPGDALLLDKTGYSPPALAFRTPSRGEIVAFTLPEGREGTGGADAGRPPGALILKRCVAAPGDLIGFSAGTITVNGSAAVTGVADGGPFLREGDVRRVPRRGDAIPLDSARCALWRDFIEAEGHALSYSPGGGMALNGAPSDTFYVTDDYFFAMGDNHAVSLDSRTWGFIPADRVVGKAVMIYWSRDDTGGVRWNRILTLPE